MPIHDWTRVGAWVYHDFHTAWLVAIRNLLNGGVLPPGFYARAEQTTRTMGPDVLTLQTRDATTPPIGNPAAARMDATATPPRVRFTAVAAARPPAFRQKRLAIRHASRDRLVAIVELVSPGNKASKHAFRTFVNKLVRAVDAGIHALVIDPFPPGRRDPNGVHGAVWPELGGAAFVLPADQPLTCAAYEAGDAGGTGPKCYVQPLAVGDPLPDMPLFLEPDVYVNVSLDRAYQTAWADVLPQDRAALGPAAAG